MDITNNKGSEIIATDSIKFPVSIDNAIPASPEIRIS